MATMKMAMKKMPRLLSHHSAIYNNPARSALISGGHSSNA
jgi:hypothetical protein